MAENNQKKFFSVSMLVRLLVYFILAFSLVVAFDSSGLFYGASLFVLLFLLEYFLRNNKFFQSAKDVILGAVGIWIAIVTYLRLATEFDYLLPSAMPMLSVICLISGVLMSVRWPGRQAARGVFLGTAVPLALLFLLIILVGGSGCGVL